MSNRKIKGFCFLCSNLYSFFMSTPAKRTLIRFNSLEEREIFSRRITQRVGIEVNEYSVLNIHQIGIEVPPEDVFGELLKWDGNSDFWPNQIARVSRIDGNLDNIVIYTFGISRIRLPLISREFRLKPLFNMSAIRIQYTPGIYEKDNARYLLYKCSGGYPIGIFCLYVRSPVANRDEKETTQLFSLVAFNFYGRKNIFNKYILYPIWRKIHNRVSGNILNKIKVNLEKRVNTGSEVQQTTN